MALADDIARSMSATAVRVAVVPGRNVIGIELPNVRREAVLLREILEADVYRSGEATLPLALGRSISGDPIVTDLARMPHLLVAGTTGSGKSVGDQRDDPVADLPAVAGRVPLPDDRSEDAGAVGLQRHSAPLDPGDHRPGQGGDGARTGRSRRWRSATSAWPQLGVRNIDVFNNRVRNAAKRGEQLARTVQTGIDARTGQPVYQRDVLELEPMPYIVVVVDEFADLMIAAGKEIEVAVQRLAQMARAAGIHLIMATQRPSVDIITGTIKANFPTRISFKVASRIDSRTILNEQGAEQLLGQGDMLFVDRAPAS